MAIKVFYYSANQFKTLVYLVSRHKCLGGAFQFQFLCKPHLHPKSPTAYSTRLPLHPFRVLMQMKSGFQFSCFVHQHGVDSTISSSLKWSVQ